MHSKYLIHGFWVLIAIGAFCAGKMQPSSPDRDSEASRSPTMSSGRLSRSLEGTGTDGTDRAMNRSAAPGSPTMSGSRLSPEAMKTALSSVLAETDPLTRQRRFGELLESLTPENARAAVEALGDAPRSRWGWGQEYSLLTYAWGRLDGPAAVAYTKELEGRTREWTMASVLAGWANQEPEQAKRWVSALESESERNSFTRGLVYGLAQKDVGAATDFVLSLDPENSRREEYIGSIARQQLAQGVTAAAEWSDSLPDGSMKAEALETVAREFVRRDPSEAAAWVARYADSGHGTSAIAEISEEWAEDDPKAALDWVTTLPEGDDRNRALSETISEWAREDAIAAGDYLAKLPAGDERDAAVGTYARRVAREDPDAAIQWAESIGGDELRNETITRTAREWFRRDVSAASAWLESAQIPEPVAQEILRPSENDERRRRR